jgi:hydrogenase maturation protein HypF
VFVEVEGPPTRSTASRVRLVTRLPPLASVTTVDVVRPRPDRRRAGFTIVASADASGERAAIPPDVATCPSCLAEVLDPADRRYRYPFANCTDCGPRYTIITRPAVRPPAPPWPGSRCAPTAPPSTPTRRDRRYHAQPIACPTCGPRLRFEPTAPRRAGTDAVIGALHATLAAAVSWR